MAFAALAAPEALELAEEVPQHVAAVGGAIAHGAGLTADEDYEGWIAIAIIAYAVLYPPLKTAWHIEQQLAGVMDQLYHWLGGAGSALEGGLKSIQNAAGAVVGALERWL